VWWRLWWQLTVESQEHPKFSVYQEICKTTSRLLSLPVFSDILLSPGVACWKPAKVVRTDVVDLALAMPSVLQDTAALVLYVGLKLFILAIVNRG
jgi:hypothetical protein